MKSLDFNALLQVIADRLGDLSGARLLDAGCGNGNFGSWLMLPNDNGLPKSRPDVYVGADYANSALADAEQRFKQIRKQQLNLDPSQRSTLVCAPRCL